MLYMFRRIKNRIVSPIVSAVYKSVMHDRDDWSKFKHDESGFVTLIHKSKRFRILKPGRNANVMIINSEGKEVCDVNWFERLILKRLVA